MKLIFVSLLLAPATETSSPTNEAPVATSPKLEEIKDKIRSAYAEMLKHTDPFAKETKDAKLALWKLEGEMKAEEQAIMKAANDAKIAEARNARLVLNQTQLDAFAAYLTAKADKKADPAKVAELESAYLAAKEVVDNELLAKYASSRPAKAKVEGDTSAAEPRDNANKAAIIELYLAGKSHKEIEEAGYKRSTVWHTIDKYKKANAQPA